MSYKLVDAVLARSRQKGSAQLVLAHIASYANDDGTGAWPSIPTLAQRTGLSERGVQKLLRQLEASGELVTETGGIRRSNTYRIVLPEVNAVPAGVNMVHPRGEPCSGGGELSSPDPVIEPAKEPVLEPSPSPAATPSVLIQRLRAPLFLRQEPRTAVPATPTPAWLSAYEGVFGMRPTPTERRELENTFGSVRRPVGTEDAIEVFQWARRQKVTSTMCAIGLATILLDSGEFTRISSNDNEGER